MQVLAEKADVDLSHTETVILELSQLMQQFNIKVAEQESMSLNISQLATESLLNVEEANVELVKAK